MKETNITFQDYLIDNDITDLGEIKDILLDLEFRILSRNSGHDYSHNKMDSIKFNNPNMDVTNSNLSRGLKLGNVIHGNTIEFSELTLLATNKANILKRIMVITETKESLHLEHEDLLDQLDFLRLSETTILDKVKFRKFKIKRITEGKNPLIKVEV